MGTLKRKEIQKNIEDIRGRPLISYVTSIRENLSAPMASDSLPSIINQLDIIPKDIQSVDFLIVSNGGDPITALRLMNILRERFDKISVIVPYVAYSAATVFALGADEIIMHPYSNLGPVDPQLTITNNKGNPNSNLQFAAEDMRNYLEYAKEDIGLNEQAYLFESFKLLCEEIGTIPIGGARRSQQLSSSLSNKMLSIHMNDSKKVNEISNKLNTSFYHHGYAVSRVEAKNIGLKIVYPEEKLESLIWDLWCDYANELKCNIPFDPMTELMSNDEARNLLTQISVVDIPANTPIQLHEQIFKSIQIQAKIQNAIQLSFPIAMIESKNLCIHFSQSMSINYWRQPDMSLGLNVITSLIPWREVDDI